MKAKQILVVVADSLFAGLTNRGIAGHESGNGGGGMVCREKQPISVKLLDFWEAEALKGIEIRRTSASVYDQIQDAIQALTAQGQGGLVPNRHALDKLYYHVEVEHKGFLPPSVGIAPPSDALNSFIAKGCGLEGIALYDDEYNTLDLDRELYDALGSTDRAGLFIHEAIYKRLRDVFHVPDSRVARNLTACAFSTTPCAELNALDGIPTSGPLYQCTNLPNSDADAPILSFALFPLDKEHINTLTKWRFQLTDWVGTGIELYSTRKILHRARLSSIFRFLRISNPMAPSKQNQSPRQYRSFGLNPLPIVGKTLDCLSRLRLRLRT